MKGDLYAEQWKAAAKVCARLMPDTTTDQPDHPWNDPDGDGHNCADCPPESIWKCDEAVRRCRCGKAGCTLPWAAHDWSYLDGAA